MNPIENLLSDLSLRSTEALQRSINYHRIQVAKLEGAEQKATEEIIRIYNTELNRRRNG